MVTILHIETFVTLDFEPSLISRLITDSDLAKSNEFSGINWCMIKLQNCKDEIAENFEYAPKTGKKSTVCLSFFFFFLSGILE